MQRVAPAHPALGRIALGLVLALYVLLITLIITQVPPLANSMADSTVILVYRCYLSLAELWSSFTEITCITTRGTAPKGSACVFPFVYSGTTHYKCTPEGSFGVMMMPWCSTSQDYTGQWGICDCRSWADRNLPSRYVVMCILSIVVMFMIVSSEQALDRARVPVWLVDLMKLVLLASFLVTGMHSLDEGDHISMPWIPMALGGGGGGGGGAYHHRLLVIFLAGWLAALINR